MNETNGTILEMNAISKTFPGVQALIAVDFLLKRGEIHALMGENGAGKSTLIKVLTGVEKADSGTIVLDGKSVQVRSPEHAQEIGISTVYQEINLCPNITVAENLLIGREPRTLGGINWSMMNTRARQILAQLEIDIDVTRTLDTYPVAIQQMVAIARALEISEAKILILDEPTSSLDAHETSKLFRVMRKLRDNGMAIIFITHFIDQVYEVTDRITVLRNGKLVGTFPTATTSHLDLIKSMLGRSLEDLNAVTRIKSETEQRVKADILLEANQFGKEGWVDPLDLNVRESEVVGLAGLLGSGRTEIAELLFGVERPDHGMLNFDGKPVKSHSPLDSINRGMVLCPEDRKVDGIVDELTVRENIILAMQASRGWFKYLSKSKQTEIADHFIELLNISTPSPEQQVKNLSGGNQQKVILARWLATNPQLLILDEPTRGIDVGAKAEIQKIILSLADQGKACLFISSELDELLRCCHRAVILRDHKKISELGGEELTETNIMHAIAGSAE